MNARSPSRRRRASRSGGSSPQPVRSPRMQNISPSVSPNRRASIAVSPVDGMQRPMLFVEMNRSPRHSIIPDISLESRSNSSDEEIPMSRSPRDLSPRNSLVPEINRSPRHSLAPGDYSRSPRNSLVPEAALSPRNSLVPDNYNRSPRNSLTPEISKSPRHSLVPDSSRSPRHSLTPDANSGSRLHLDFNRSPRNSLLPDGRRGSRQVLVTSDSTSPDDFVIDMSPRHSITPDCNRSPRGSIAPERTSPRGSIASEHIPDRSPRGSIGGHRDNLSKSNLLSSDRSPRGSLTFTFQDPPKHSRRYSTDYGRSNSPYRSSRGNFNQGYNQSQTSGMEGGSRRASSSVSQTARGVNDNWGNQSVLQMFIYDRTLSQGQGNGWFLMYGDLRVCSVQVSTDEQKHLFSDKNYDAGEGQLGMALTLTTYGSVAYQLKDANLEANDTCDFLCRAMQILNKTAVMTVALICLSTLTMVMLVMGAQFLRDCPREPYIPIYMLVGGTVGGVKMAWLLWNHLYNNRIVVSGTPDTTTIATRILSCMLTIFLMIWFALGTYWILQIKWPDYNPTLYEPNRWCHPTLYIFAIVHLCILYTGLGTMFLLNVTLAACQILECPCLTTAVSYK